MRFLTFVFKNVTRRRIRSVLTISGLAVAVGAVVSLVGIANGFERSFLRLYEGHGVDVVVLQKGIADPMMSVLDASLAEQVRKIEGVARVDAQLLGLTSFSDYGLYGVVVQGIDPSSGWLKDYRLIDGVGLSADDTKTALIGEVLADQMGKKLGDEIEVFEDHSYRLVGRIKSQNLFENNSLILPLAELQSRELLDREGQVTIFNVVVEKPVTPAAVKRVCTEIEKLSGRLSASPTRDFVSSDQKIKAAAAMAWATSAIALLVGAIGMLNTMIMSVFERTREIGILRAIGWGKARVVRMILLEAGLLSFMGAIVGTLGAIAVTWLLRFVPTIALIVGDRLDPAVVGLGFVIAMCIGMFGAAYPAYVGARLLPTEALRHD